ncbi:MAG TPA: aldose 1-epimerase [Burkholderiaceae bacterium]|nr:aldose 1-epimerase [Burkholderiaceae bacterium]
MKNATVELRAGALRLAVRGDLGGCIAGLWFRDTPVLRSTEPGVLASSRQSACYPLVPYSNRLGYRRFQWNGQTYRTLSNFDNSPHSLHGVAWQRPWETLSLGAPEVVLRYRHTPDGHWPFAFETTQHFTLTPQALHVWLKAINLDAVEQPVGLGWHPYFPKRAGSHVRFAVKERWESDETDLPTHAVAQPGVDAAVADLAFDHCFGGWSGPARITDEHLSLTLSSSLPYVVVFTPPTRDYFCVEPVSHLSNAINMSDPRAHGVKALRSGAAFETEMKLEINER